MKRVVLTGGTGFIGRHTIPELLARGYEVHCLGRSAPKDHVHFHEADLLHQRDLNELMARIKPTHLLHLAWYTEHGKFWTSDMNLDWLAASLSLARAFVAAGGTHIVAAGTCAEYDWSHTRLIENATPTRPGTLYGVAKDALRQTLEKFCAMHNIRFAWGRVFFLYGPDEAPGRFVPSMIRPLLAGQEARCRSGAHVRDLMHVKDVAAAFVAMLDSAVSGPVNIASGTPATLGQIAQTIGQIVGREELLRIEQLPGTPENPQVMEADIERLTREVGFAPRYDLQAGLKEVVASYRSA